MQNQKQYTNASLYEVDSVIHARQQDGIEVLDLGYISNSGMKMTFTVGNAEIVSRLIKEQLEVVEEVTVLANLIVNIIEPLHFLIDNNVRNINSIIYNNYREVLKEAVLSVEYSRDKMSCAKKIAYDVIKSLEKKNNILSELVTSPRFFTEQVEVEKLETLTISLRRR
ncbi:MAG: hypothetical protein P1U74_04695 [Legionellaceae bacterium]|nr:hypothetical protein [Legionellaceae bacterium]